MSKITRNTINFVDEEGTTKEIFNRFRQAFNLPEEQSEEVKNAVEREIGLIMLAHERAIFNVFKNQMEDMTKYSLEIEQEYFMEEEDGKEI